METQHKEIESLLRELLSILEEDVTLIVEDDTQDGIYVNLEGSLFALPEEQSALAALEHLVRSAIRRKTGKELDIVIDVNGAVKKRRAELIRFALTKAEEVRRERKRVRLNAMPAHERRTIHVALANFPGVRTFSTGDGDGRRVMIEPDDAQ
ncbi:MAG: R3H domain-containing nucleic acid-binding protein [Candidatus Bipolaricaulota bacterium]